MNKCRFRITTPLCRHEVMEMPQEDWYAGHQALLTALGIPDANPVACEAEAESLAANANAAYQDIAQVAAGSGKNTGKKRK